MRNSKLLTSVLILFLSVPASITWAQTITSQKGLTTAVFPTQYGSIKVYLPDDIRPGDIISGTIVAEPKGNNPKQIEKNLEELEKYSIKIDGNTIDDRQGWSWQVQQNRQREVFIELLNAKGNNAGQLPVQFAKEQDKQPAKPKCAIPSHALTGAPLRITGSFDGDASNTKCSLNGIKMEILAESPSQCFVTYPADASGLKTMSIQENEKQVCDQQVSSIQLSVSAGRLNLMKGEKTQIDVSISGLKGLKKTATLSLTNTTFNVVKLLPANTILIPLDSFICPDGFFSQSFEVQSLKSGAFSVNVNLDLPEEEKPVFANIDWRALKNESGFPGSYGYIGDQPCEPDGKTIKWRWKRAFPCEIDKREVLACGQTKESAEILEKIKELLEEAELDKATDIAEKMAKAFSTSKMFSYSVHVIRKYVIYDIEYKCVNGKWQATGGVYVNDGIDDLGWQEVNHLTTKCWMTFDSLAAEKEFDAALEHALRMACK